LAGVGCAARGEEAASTAEAPAPELLSFPESQLEPLHWAAVEGWHEDDHLAAFATFQASCKPLIARFKWGQRKTRPGTRPPDLRPMRLALTQVCMRAAEAKPPDAANARAFFEEHFRPVQVGKLGEETGLLTGYYEPIIQGSRFPSHEYVVPVYAPPSDLVALGARGDGGAFPNKGRVGRRVGPKQFVPYHDRAGIEDGAIAGQGFEICWVKDPIDAFFMQIQGSARIKLDTGKTMRLNYAAHNGHPYTPVGRLLIERREVPREEMSMDRIRQWMEKSADNGKQLRRENRSYVFMRETGLADDAEPTGAQGVSLTPGRSIAVDRKLHVYGTPFFISAALPIDGERPVTPFRRLMVAQDTGSAIVGVARADIYFGAGEELGRIAGRIKQQGKFVMLVPVAIDPSVGSDAVPLPPSRPRQPGDPILVASGPPNTAMAYAPSDRPAPGPPAAVVAAGRGTPAKMEPPVAARKVPLPPRRPAGPEAKEPMQEAKVSPLLEIMRPQEIKGPPAMPDTLAAGRLPEWLLAAAPLASAPPGSVSAMGALPARSFASAHEAIAAANSAPLAFAAPAVAHAAASVFGEISPNLAVPAPRPRPSGIVPSPR
jgi:membrane-bound lytic murein transglycosylase A